MKHWKYFKYVVKHRWFVFLECCKLGIPWQGIIHDISKFYISEWFPYVEQFYGEYGYKFDKEMVAYVPLGYSINQIRFLRATKAKETKQRFDYAWLYHQKRNPHHHQYWVLQNDSDGLYPLEMPERYIKEMIADWISAGYCITGKREVKVWYEKNKDNMKLHSKTKEKVEELLGRL